MLSSLVMRSLPYMLGTRGKQRLSILIYHRVLPVHDPMRPGEPTVPEFDWQMRLLRDHFSPLPLIEAVDRLQNGKLPDNAVSVTFDDGYSDNERYALPVLLRYGIPATVFVSTGYLNGGRMWNDSIIEVARKYDKPTLDLTESNLGCYPMNTIEQRLAAVSDIIGKVRYLPPAVRQQRAIDIEQRYPELPRDLMMTDDQVRSFAGRGMAVGAHTVTHPILSSLDLEEARREVYSSKLALEQIVQQPVDTFAYPNGKPAKDYGEEHRAMVSELGFRVAVSTHWGVSTPESDRFQLPRFTPWDRQEWKFALRLMLSYRAVDPLVGRD